MNGPLYILLVRLGVPAAIAGAIVIAASAFLGACTNGESFTITRAPTSVTVPTQAVTVPPQVVVPTANLGVPQK